MNILLVVHQFFPQFSAGTEVLTLGVARELRARGHLVRILSGHPATDDGAEPGRRTRDQYDDFEVYRFHHAYVPMGGQRSMLEIGSDNHLAAHYLREILDEFRADRIHYFHLNRLGTGLIVEADRAGVPQSLTPTDFWIICPTAQLRLPDGHTCDGPSRHAGNCALHFASWPAVTPTPPHRITATERAFFRNSEPLSSAATEAPQAGSTRMRCSSNTSSQAATAAASDTTTLSMGCSLARSSARSQTCRAPNEVAMDRISGNSTGAPAPRAWA